MMMAALAGGWPAKNSAIISAVASKRADDKTRD